MGMGHGSSEQFNIYIINNKIFLKKIVSVQCILRLTFMPRMISDVINHI